MSAQPNQNKPEDPPFPSGSGASCSRPGPAAPARLRASGGRAPAPGSRGGRGGRDGATRAARLDGRPCSRGRRLPARSRRRGEAAFADAGHPFARSLARLLARCPTPKTAKAAVKTSAPTAAETSRKMEPGPWPWRARRARRLGGPWRRRPAAGRRCRARRAPGARRASEARGLEPRTARPPRGPWPRETPRTVSRGRRGERQLPPPRRGRGRRVDNASQEVAARRGAPHARLPARGRALSGPVPSRPGVRGLCGGWQEEGGQSRPSEEKGPMEKLGTTPFFPVRPTHPLPPPGLLRRWPRV